MLACQKNNFSVRAAVSADLPAILAIEDASFPSPWSEPMYEMEFEREICVFLVAEDDGVMTGYVCAWIVADECHVLKIAVSPDHRRVGIGRTLLVALEDEAARRGADKYWLEVRSTNDAGRSFYERMGYDELGVRRGYYHDSGEDAVVLAKIMESDREPC